MFKALYSLQSGQAILPFTSPPGSQVTTSNMSTPVYSFVLTDNEVVIVFSTALEYKVIKTVNLKHKARKAMPFCENCPLLTCDSL